jgi:hypothetical protein
LPVSKLISAPAISTEARPTSSEVIGFLSAASGWLRGSLLVAGSLAES